MVLCHQIVIQLIRLLITTFTPAKMSETGILLYLELESSWRCPCLFIKTTISMSGPVFFIVTKIQSYSWWSQLVKDLNCPDNEGTKKEEVNHKNL